MHIKQTHISNTRPNLLKEHVSQTHGLTEKINNETPTSGHKTLGVMWLLERHTSHQSSVSGDRFAAPNSPTFHTADR